MQKVLVEACDVWNYCIENEEVLEYESQEIASNSLNGISVWVSMDEGLAQVYVLEDGEEIVSVEFDDPDWCCMEMKEIYDEYIFELGNSYLDFGDKEYERKVEIEQATVDWLDVAIQQDPYKVFEDYEIEEISDSFLKHLRDEYGMQVYRPIVSEYSEDYPWDSGDYDFDYDAECKELDDSLWENEVYES